MHLLELVVEVMAGLFGEVSPPKKAGRRTYALRILLILALLVLLFAPLYFFLF